MKDDCHRELFLLKFSVNIRTLSITEKAIFKAIYYPNRLQCSSINESLVSIHGINLSLNLKSTKTLCLS